MFEGLIEKLILSYFGDYIENLDRKKLSVGIISGSLTLEDIVIKSKTINDMKLPFRLIYGRIGKLDIKIPWKSNFSAPTIINIDTIQIVLSLIPKSEWEFLDFFSADYKLNLLKKFFDNRIAELTEAFLQEEKSSGYVDRVLIKILDNLHVNFKNLHIRIEDTTKKPFYSLGFTLEEMLVVNTNENWEEKFIDRNKQKDINVFKLLKIQNFGFYLKTDENYFIGNSNYNEKKIKEEMNSMFNLKNNNFEYLINPISVVAKMKQNNSLIENINENSNLNNLNNLAKIQIWINLENFDINFQKSQFDTIIRILNHISNYQRFQYFKYESRKFYFYRPSLKSNKKAWWRYAITSVIKRLKYLQGNLDQFKINPLLQIHYKNTFNLIYKIYLKDPNVLTNQQLETFNKILTIFDLNIIYEWAIENIQEYFKENKIEENKKNKKGFFGKMFGSKSDDQNLLTKEEEDKIQEIIEYAKKEVKNEIIYSGKEIKLSIQFKLNEGSFNFCNNKKNSTILESFLVKYKNLNFMLKSADAFTEIDAYLIDFNIYMVTEYNKNNIKTNQITFKNDIRSDNNYLWKLNFKQFGPEEKINSHFLLHIQTINLIYHQAFLERILSFFIVETHIEEDIVNRAWDKWSEIKEKTSEQIKLALEKKNILEINIEPRRLLIPLNKYNFKMSRILVFEIGKVSMCNTESARNYDDQYLLDFVNLSISHYESFAKMEENLNKFEIVSDFGMKIIMSIRNKIEQIHYINMDESIKTPQFKMTLLIDKININLTESIFYTFFFINDLLKPNKQQDYWAIVAQSKQEIKKNCKALGRIGKKNLIKQYYEEFFAVLSGGYIYFYKNSEDDEFSNCYYIKDAILIERIKEENMNNVIYEINLKNKYGSLDLEFNNESKFKQWTKSLKERINEMKGSLDNINSNINNELSIQNENKISIQNENKISIQNISPLFGLEIDIKNVLAHFNDEKNNLEKIFTLNSSEFNLNIIIMEKEIEIKMSLYSIKLYDEKYNNHLHKNSLYEILTSIDDEKSDCKLFTIDIIIADENSTRFNKAGIEIDLKFGFVYVIWNPESIRRLLMFLAHNDILKDKVKEEIIGIGRVDLENNITENNITENKNETLITCTSTPNELWININITIQKISIIWVQPVLIHYFIELKMNQSNITVEMACDHFTIKGVMGNTTLSDLTNYPYTIKSQEEYLELKNKNTKFTEIIGFKDFSSLNFEFKSYSIFCPHVKNNYTSSAHVNFNQIKFTYIQEHFFRVFNYLFSEFLGAFGPDEEIKNYRNFINKIPPKNSHQMEFMDLHVMFDNPQVMLKPREKFEFGFLADLGNIVITNQYEKVFARNRNDLLKEYYLSVYNFDLKNLFLDSFNCENSFKLIEDTMMSVKMRFPNLSGEEKNLPDEIIDKSFDINLNIGDVKLNLRQRDLTNFMKCNDLNFLYTDGLDKFYQYESYKKMISRINLNGEEKNLIENDIPIENNFDNSGQFKLKEANYNSMIVNLEIPLIQLRLYDNYTNNIFTELMLIDMNLNFAKKIYGAKEINLIIRNSEVYNYMSVYNKEIMISYFDNTNNNNNNNIKTPQAQFDIKIHFDKEGEKNIIIKIFNIKLTLRVDTLQLIMTFFTGGLPFYSESELDIPNQYDFDEDNYPGMRVYIEIKNPLISLLSETMTNHDQDVICLQTDLVFLYKKEKIIKARRELHNNYINLMKTELDNTDKILLEKDIDEDSKEIYMMSVWLYDICPYVSVLSDIINMNNSNLNLPKRKLMNDFNFHFENKTLLQYNHPSNYIQSYKSAMDINQITMKISYRDLVLFLKTLEYNINLMDKEYEEKLKHLINLKINRNIIKSNEKEMNPSVVSSKENLIRKSKTNDDITIDKGMGVIQFESKGIQIILIDDHANTYYPFLSIILQDLKFMNESMSFTQNAISGSLLIKIVTYNYFAGIWEPFMEKTNLKFEITNEKSESDQIYQTFNFTIDALNRQAMNLNISDINITFLYSTLSSWFEKYSKLKSNYREEVKKMIAIHSDKNMTISNHTVINLTGRNLILHRANFIQQNNEKRIIYSKLKNVEPNMTYDIEYLEDDYKEVFKKSHSSSNNNINNTNDISLNLVKENFICFEFSGIDQSKISENLIKIENEQLKTHKINFCDLTKKYKINPDLKQMEYIISEVKYHNLRKYVYFYSPLIFKNKLQRQMILILRRKDLPEMNILLEPKKQMGVPYEYLDGSIEFCIKEKSGVVYDIKTFLNTTFNKSEMRFENNIFNLLTDNSDNRKKKTITINICASYVIRNCLPFDLELNVFTNSLKQNVNFNILKSERIYLEILSLQDNLICNMKFQNFQNNKKQPIILFNIKEYFDKLERKTNSKDLNNTLYTTSFIIFDNNNNPLKLFATLVDSTDFRTIVIYCNGVIINNTLMDLKFYYANKNKKYEIGGQGDIVNRNSNVLLISEENKIAIEVVNKNNNKLIISDSYPINTIGISTNIECKSNDNKIIYEFIMETNLSLIAHDLEIFTNIITIHPKFVIFNNLQIPILICLKNLDYITPEKINPGQKKPFHHFGFNSETPVCFRPIDNTLNIYQSGSKWNWSYPISLIHSGIMTIQIPGINPIEKKYINMEKKILDYTTFVILNEATYNNSQFVIENYSKNVSIKIYQQGYELSPEYVNTESKCLFAWSDYNSNKNLVIEYMIGNLSDRPIIPQMCQNFIRKFKIEDDLIIVENLEEKSYPFREVTKICFNSYSGFLIQTEIFTDGMKKTIRISDYVKNKQINTITNNLNESKTNSSNNLKIIPKISPYSRIIKEVNIKINKLGISLISDNRNLKNRRSNYNRYEIVYFTLTDIKYYQRTEINRDDSIMREMQLKINSMKIDNEYNYITQYPITLRPVNIIKDSKSGEIIIPENSPPFVNFTLTSYKNNNNNPNETTKIILLNYLIQSFVFSIDSEVVECILNFISNITTQLNTTFTQINPLFESYIENEKKEVIIKDNFLPPKWIRNDKNFDPILTENSLKFFIQTMETSSIEIVLSFNAQTKSKVFEKYVTSNPILSSILSTVSNLEKANILLNGSKMSNLYGNLLDIFQLILSQYKQSLLAQVLRIFGAIDVLGNPSNLVSNLGTGVQDFFQKPIQGIIKGPLEGVKGAIDGSMSLVRHTIDGTFNATQKISGGLSKGILYLTQDEKYINELEKKKITERPKNFVEGIGYGITSMASGLYSGVSDVFVKPVEGAKNESVTGFGKGVLQGIGGLFAKPISGVLELVSKTSEGIKNTISSDDYVFKLERKPRAFYCKFKYIKSYNFFHADVIYILKNKIEQFKGISFDFYSAEIYKNHKGDTILLVFTTYNMYIIDLDRREIKVALKYDEIRNVVLEANDKIRINFKHEMNSKSSAVIFFSKINSNAPEIYEKIKEALDDNSEEFNF